MPVRLTPRDTSVPPGMYLSRWFGLLKKCVLQPAKNSSPDHGTCCFFGMVFDVGGSRRILEPDGSTHPKSRCSETIRYEKSTHRGNVQVILPQYQVQV